MPDGVQCPMHAARAHAHTYIHTYVVCPLSSRTYVIKHISNPNYKNTILPSEVVLMESSALSHPSPSHLSALLEGLFWNLPQPHRSCFTDVVHVSKTDPTESIVTANSCHRARISSHMSIHRDMNAFSSFSACKKRKM